MIVFPSLGILARGVIFGPFTPFLIYFLPFIWLTNLILILVFKKFFNLKYLLSVFFAAAAKYLFLLTVANIYFELHFVPKIFLQVMSTNQLLTALSGGIISWIIFNIYGELNAGNRQTA